MSATENQLFDAAFPIKIGKQEFQASMLTDRDYGDLDLYIKARFIHLVRLTAAELSEEEKKEITSIAIRDSLKIGWGTQEGIDLVFREDGILHLGYQMIRKRHERMTFSKFETIARGKQNEDGQWSNLRDSVEQILIAWDHFNPTLADNTGDNGTEEDLGGSSTGSEKSFEEKPTD